MIRATFDIFWVLTLKSEFWEWIQESEKKIQNSEIKVRILMLKLVFWEQSQKAEINVRIPKFWDQQQNSRIRRSESEF